MRYYSSFFLIVYIYLYVTRAFNNVEHRHVIRKFKSNGVPSLLINTVLQYLQYLFTPERNRINICPLWCTHGSTHVDHLNITIDHIFREFCGPQIAQWLGYKLAENKDCIALTRFADNRV